MKPLSLLIAPTAKQKEFLRAAHKHKYVLYGGAKGGGKSRILRWWLVWQLFEWAKAGHRGVRVGMFCEDYPALKDRQISKVKREFPRELGEYHEQDHEFRLRPEWGGGVICFRNLDEPSKYDGAEFAAMAVDELAKNPAETFHILRSCLRWPGIAHTPFAGATNPAGKGLAWVRQLWIERDFSDQPGLDPDQFAFVQARAEDNPHLDGSYYDTLKSLPEHMRRALWEGDWYVFEGQFFHEFRTSLHACTPFEIPDGWTRWRAVDYGTSDLERTFACLWIAQDPDTGRRFVYREWYAKGQTAERQAQGILDRSGPERFAFTRADPSMFRTARTDGAGPADVYARCGVPLVPALNNRVWGWNNVRTALTVREDGLPGLQIFSTCRDLLRTLPVLVYGPFPDDLDTDGEDHLADALRYGLSLGEVKLARRVPKRPKGNPWTTGMVRHG